MSYHVTYNHECPQCGAYYIPFDQAVPCPKCGEIESERFDFISEAATSASINLMEGDYYEPAAWYVGSLGDHILSILFDVLDEHREDTSGRASPTLLRMLLLAWIGAASLISETTLTLLLAESANTSTAMKPTPMTPETPDPYGGYSTGSSTERKAWVKVDPPLFRPPAP